MKIYVITSGEYSDYHICAVTDDPNKAEILRKQYTDRWDVAEIEEWDTEEPVINEGSKYYKVDFNCKGEAIRAFESSPYSSKDIGTIDKWTVELYAKDEETAIKIAAERRAKYLAEKQGI